ncbi:MAG: hypothetical protein MJY48_02810 [Bacteroidales bacterium]|nr:hypothetical protein [Bacteroidales bacterium]
MSRRILYSLLTAGAVLVSGAIAYAQQSSGTYSAYTPYSSFGVGDLSTPGTAYNGTMGGVGIASRNTRFINTINPAAATVRDSLSVMADFSLSYKHKLISYNNLHEISDVFNINSLAISLPIYRSLSFIAGIKPYSNVGYKSVSYEKNKSFIGIVGDIAYSQYGQGSLYQLYGGLAVDIVKGLSVGAQYEFYFGHTSKSYLQTFSLSKYNGLSDEFESKITASSGKFGIQYEKIFAKKVSVSIGATYQLKAKLNGVTERYIYPASSQLGAIVSDTLNLNTLDTRLTLASEIGVGIAINYMDKVRAEFDYTRADWSKSNFDKVDGFAVESSSGFAYKPDVAQSFRLGVEITPNRNDIRYYYKKISYRFGAYYNQEYYRINGNPIASVGITLGATLPVFRWHNGITLGVEIGERGSFKANLLKERFFGASIGINLYDIWFVKHYYE